MRSRQLAAAVVALALGPGLLGAGCSRDGDAETTPREPTPVPGGQTTKPPAPAEIDVSVIPEKIDEPYINAVLAALNEVDGRATRLIAQERQLVLEATSFLAAIYDDEELQEQTEAWLRTIKGGLNNIKTEPGSRRQTITRLVSASSTCVFLHVEEDLSATTVSPSPPHRSFVQLVPVDAARRRQGLNPTAWMIHLEGETADGSEPGDPCAA